MRGSTYALAPPTPRRVSLKGLHQDIQPTALLIRGSGNCKRQAEGGTVLPSLLHCERIRRPYRRVTIRPPKASAQYLRSEVWLNEQFTSIDIYYYRCGHCQDSQIDEPMTWVGTYADERRGKYGRFQQQKIPHAERWRWLEWADSLRIVDDNKGVDLVQGSRRERYSGKYRFGNWPVY